MVISRFQTPKVANPNKVKALMDMHDDEDDETPPVIQASVTQKAVQPGALTPQQQHEQAKATAKENSKQLQKDSVHAEAEKNRRAGYGGLIGQQEDAAAAAQQELAAGKAKAQLDAQSRSNLGGMGLSGASAAINSDVGKQQDRNAVLTMDALRKSQNDERFTKVQQMAALDDVEEQTHTDLDHDGDINGVPVGQVDSAETEAAQQDFLAHLTNSVDLQYGDENTEPGTIEEPFVLDQAGVDKANGMGLELEETRRETKANTNDVYVIYTDKNGTVYAVKQDRKTTRNIGGG